MSTAKERASFEKVMKNLNREIEGIRGRTMKGLIRGAIIVRRAIDTESPSIPVDTGNLRQSWFVTTSKGNTKEGQNPEFKGKGAGKMSARHSSVVPNMQTLATSKGNKNKPLLIMGFSANYATSVHENVGTHFRRPGSGAKFFESAIKNHEKEILDVIKKEAKVKR